MEQLAHAFSTIEPRPPELANITTMLGELIEAINEEVEPEDDHLVAKIVLNLLERRRIKLLNPKGKLYLPWLS